MPLHNKSFFVKRTLTGRSIEPVLYRTLNHVFLRDAEFAVELLSMTVEQVFEKIENLQRAEST